MNLPSEELAAINELLTSAPEGSNKLADAIQSAVRELSGGPPMTRAERFVVFSHVYDKSCPLDEADALTRGLGGLMELVDPSWSDGQNMGDAWASHAGCHPDALQLLDLGVRRSCAAEDMVHAVRAGLSVYRRDGSTLSDRQRKRLENCWRWDARGAWCQAVDALLLAIDRRRGHKEQPAG